MRRHPTDGSGPTRRSFLARSVAGAGLVTAGIPGTGAAALWRRNPSDPEPRARSVIQVFLHGGLSHLDTFDPKPDAPPDVRGPFGTVKTAIDGLRFSELCRQTAAVADKLTVVRSMTHTEAAHERGTHNMLTGYRPSPALVYPSFGSVVSHEQGPRADLPAYVAIPDARIPDLGTGYLGAAHGPFSLGGEPVRDDFKVRDLLPADGVDAERIARRRRMVDGLDAGYRASADAIDATGVFYDQAWQLIESDTAREAFRISAEDGKVRDRYGRHTMGQRLLLARRLVEAGVRYVGVTDGGWDHHRDVENSLRRQMPSVDQAFAALIADLDARGLLDQVLVLFTSEFGRTPRINQDRGRDHWPRVFTVLAAGGGVKRGAVVGASDPGGAEPAEAAVSPADLAATMFRLIGIDHEKRLMSPGDRPIDIVRGGRVMREILA